MLGKLIHYALLGAIRDRFVLSIFVVMVLGASLSVFLGSSAVIEQKQFIQVFAAGGLRIILALCLILFVVFFVRKSADTKDVEALLSKPISRFQYLLSFSFSFSIIALFVGILSGVAVILIYPEGISAGLSLWILSICVENIIVVNMALFFAMVLSSSTSASMATIGFYLLCRMMGQILGIIDASPHDSLFNSFLERLMEVISICLPRLDLFGQSSWIIYGPDKGVDALFILLQGGIFVPMIFTAALFDLLRRQF